MSSQILGSTPNKALKYLKFSARLELKIDVAIETKFDPLLPILIMTDNVAGAMVVHYTGQGKGPDGLMNHIKFYFNVVNLYSVKQKPDFCGS